MGSAGKSNIHPELGSIVACEMREMIDALRADGEIKSFIRRRGSGTRGGQEGGAAALGAQWFIGGKRVP